MNKFFIDIEYLYLNGEVVIVITNVEDCDIIK
jgi:hypothetical protein